MNNSIFEYALNAAEIGYWELDVNSLKAMRTLKHDQIFGYESLLPEWSYEIATTHVYSEDLEKFRTAFDALYKQGIEFNLEFRIIRHDGAIRWLWAFGRPFNNPDDKLFIVAGLVKDITNEYATRAKLEKTEAFFKQFADHVDAAFYEMSDDLTEITFLSNAITRISGESRKYFENQTAKWLDFIVTEDRNKVDQFYRDKVKVIKNTNTSDAIEYRIKRNDGVIRHILDRSFKANDRNNKVVGILGVIADLTEVYAKRRIESVLIDVENVLNMKSSLEDVSLGVIRIFCNAFQFNMGQVWMLDDKKQSLFLLNSYSKNIAVNEQFMIQQHDNIADAKDGIYSQILSSSNVITIRDDKKFYGSFSNLVAAKLIFNNETLGIISFFHNDDYEISKDIISLLLKLANQFSIHLHERFIQDQVSFISNYDIVTGLTNRESMIKILKDLLAIPPSKPIVLMKVMIDQMSKINQTFGGDISNQLLKSIVVYFVKDPHPNVHLISSLGEGFFSFILKGLDNLQEINDVALKLLNIKTQSFYVNKNEIFITLSVGVSIFPQDGKNEKLLMMSAKSSVIRAHKSGGNVIEYSSSALQNEMFEQVNIEFALHRALERNEFVLHYQPKVSFATGKIVGAESLIRWQEPNGTLHMPGYFIDIAERSDLIVLIGEWVLREVCRQIAKDPFGVPIAVNLSIRQFKKEGYFLKFVKDTINEFDINPAMLEFEVTESILMVGGQIVDDFKHLNKMGIRISFDDFGTKYCSLNYLKDYIPYRIKIDKSFVDGVPGSATNIAIIKAIITLAKALNIILTVEGAEKEDQVSFFIKLGCEELQSWYISRAVPSTEFKKLLARNYKTLFDKLS